MLSQLARCGYLLITVLILQGCFPKKDVWNFAINSPQNNTQIKQNSSNSIIVFGRFYLEKASLTDKEKEKLLSKAKSLSEEDKEELRSKLSTISDKELKSFLSKEFKSETKDKKIPRLKGTLICNKVKGTITQIGSYGSWVVRGVKLKEGLNTITCSFYDKKRTIKRRVSVTYNEVDESLPVAVLNVTKSSCDSPCTVTLNASASKPGVGGAISEYIFETGDGKKVISQSPSIEHTYYNYLPESTNNSTVSFKAKLKVVQADMKESSVVEKLITVNATNTLPTIDGGDLIPPPPNEELNDSTLKGIDIDNDGVRDDVELWINRTYSDSADIRRALKQNAKNLQRKLDFIDDKEASIESTKNALREAECLYHVLNYEMLRASKVSKSLRVIFFNTRARLIAEDKISTDFNGQSLPERPGKDENYGCSFNLTKKGAK